MTSLTTGDDRITLSHQTSGHLEPEERDVLLRTPQGLPLFTLPDKDNGELYDPTRIVKELEKVMAEKDDTEALLTSIPQFIGVPTETNRLDASRVYPTTNIAIHIRGRTDIPNYIHSEKSTIEAGLPLQTVFVGKVVDGSLKFFWYVCASQNAKGGLDIMLGKKEIEWYCICPMGRVLRATKRGIHDSNKFADMTGPGKAKLPWRDERCIKSLVSAYITA